MFHRRPQRPSALDKVIEHHLEQLYLERFDTEKYPKMLAQLSKLYAMKEIETPKRVSPDTLAVVAGNIVGIVLILGYERAHVMTSKAIGFVLRLR